MTSVWVGVTFGVLVSVTAQFTVHHSCPIKSGKMEYFSQFLLNSLYTFGGPRLVTCGQADNAKLVDAFHFALSVNMRIKY
jgi:hypothetical protein